MTAVLGLEKGQPGGDEFGEVLRNKVKSGLRES